MIRENLTCEMCSRRPAKVVCLRRRQEDVVRTFVCMECANESARLYTGSCLDFERIFSRVGDALAQGKPVTYGCKLCGATLADVVTDGRPGCCMCYLKFAAEIEQAVETAQGHTYHVGKTPER